MLPKNFPGRRVKRQFGALNRAMKRVETGKIAYTNVRGITAEANVEAAQTEVDNLLINKKLVVGGDFTLIQMARERRSKKRRGDA